MLEQVFSDSGNLLLSSALKLLGKSPFTYIIEIILACDYLKSCFLPSECSSQLRSKCTSWVSSPGSYESNCLLRSPLFLTLTHLLAHWQHTSDHAHWKVHFIIVNINKSTFSENCLNLVVILLVLPSCPSSSSTIDWESVFL